MEDFNIIAGIASILGLVFSTLAFIQAKRAHAAATQARDAVTYRVVADELELACLRAEQLVDFLEHKRFDEAALRVAELTSSLSELPHRRGSYLQSCGDGWHGRLNLSPKEMPRQVDWLSPLAAVLHAGLFGAYFYRGQYWEEIWILN